MAQRRIIPDPTIPELLGVLEKAGSREVVRGQARFGVVVEKSYGVTAPKLRVLAKSIGKNHRIAAALWKTGIHDAQMLAALVDDPSKVTEVQMERWVRQIRSWDLCDNCCCVLFDKTPFVRKKAIAWSRAEGEYVKRAGFVLMAALAVHDKAALDEDFLPFFECIVAECSDGRNFVKKAVNWSLRQIGKRNLVLNVLALKTAARVAMQQSSAARWIAADAIRELRSAPVQRRLQQKELRHNTGK
ncbi:MAG: DNA alkylation repair protein [Ignavibacteriales bacterium]|nr:DNA alkylation repair protein [Ignavibacteriales bacterium]